MKDEKETTIDEEREAVDLFNLPIIERKDYGGMRYYISRDADMNIIASAPSVTTILSMAMPVNSFLDDWKFGFGGKLEYRQAMDTMAYYGTLLHIVKDKLALQIPLMLDDEYIDKMFHLNETELTEYKHVHLPATVNGTDYDKDKFRKDAIALYVFFNDVYKSGETELAGIEVTLADFKLGFAGTIDLVLKKGDRYIIIDYKTGTGHYRSHELQLEAYRVLLAGYLGISADNIDIYNLNTKDYREETLKAYLNGESKTTPYKLIKVKSAVGFEQYLNIFNMEYKRPDFEKKEINYNTTIDNVIKQIKGDEPKGEQDENNEING